jgi:UDPglucose 6-dehydrogenase
MKVAIVGLGYVGTAMNKLFEQAVVYDEPKGVGSRGEVNACEAAFVCVPTPMGEDGACVTAIVEDVLGWLETDVIILRSTVPVGFTKRMCAKTGKSIVFQPEYCGETADHPYVDLSRRAWITLGGEREAVEKAVQVYQQVYSSEVRIKVVDSRTAELAKYMENCFLAAKVTFCNEFYDIAQKAGVDYTELRETWLMDERMGRSHTFVYPEKRGYDGKCLPKDVAALINQADELGADATFMKAVQEKNEQYR